jgi:HlyD family secretion protein
MIITDRKKKILSFGSLSIVLVGAAFAINFLFFSNPFYYAGTLEVTLVDIAARLPAAIDEVKVHEGDRVTKDQVLITFACENFKTDARFAQAEYDRNKKLFKDNFISANVFDQYRTWLEDANTKVNWCTLTSPLTGTVLDRPHEPGEWMNPGTAILTLGNIHDIWAYIYVPQPLVAKLSPGMKLKGYLPELKMKEFDGRILKINDVAEFTPKNVQTQEERERLIYGVKVSFLESNADEILKPGMTIEVALPK